MSWLVRSGVRSSHMHKRMRGVHWAGCPNHEHLDTKKQCSFAPGSERLRLATPPGGVKFVTPGDPDPVSWEWAMRAVSVYGRWVTILEHDNGHVAFSDRDAWPVAVPVSDRYLCRPSATLVHQERNIWLSMIKSHGTGLFLFFHSWG